MNKVSLTLSNVLTATDPESCPVLIVGQLKNLSKVKYDTIKAKLQPRVSEEMYNSALHSLQPSDTCPLWLSSVMLASLPSKCSRHNAPSRAHSLTRVVRSNSSGGSECIVLVCEKNDLYASVCGIAKAFPIYCCKTSTGYKNKRTVNIEILLVQPCLDSDQMLRSNYSNSCSLSQNDLQCLDDVMTSIRLAAVITDKPCSEMHTDSFIEEIKKVGVELNITPFIIQGDELLEKGFGGIHGVGRAAIHQPALVVLSHKPPAATKSIAWVGKGIVYDTGGLSIKAKTTMPGMKRDCGGAAAVLGAFYTAVRQGFKENLHAIFCLAENAVGPKSLRPDDVITLYSKRTIEVNNTDAEGRLVLGDGVSYAAKDLKADVIVDLATLTGAQGLATGRYHGVLLTNRAQWEPPAVSAGRMSADLVHPMIYCPELHFSEFTSHVADMKNSSADRSNAEVSCAGLFIGAQLGFDYGGTWLHIDMAYPVHSGERATGYGVGLLTTLFGSLTESELLKLIAPKISINKVARQTGQAVDKSCSANNGLIDRSEESSDNGNKKIKLH